MQKLKIKPWGPGPLRNITETLVDAINKRTPLPSETIDIDERPDGAQIIRKDDVTGDSEDSAKVDPGGDGGTNVDIVGMLNAAPATFHLLQSSAPTPL